MISFEKAFSLIMNSAFLLDAETVKLEHSLGRVLSCDIRSDIDMPPFDKSSMDGYACRREDLGEPLRIIEVIPAGRNPLKTVRKNECSQIMTGAIVPKGADCVVIVENTQNIAEDKIVVTDVALPDNSHIFLQGEDIKKDEVVLGEGTRLLPQHMAVLAEVGIKDVPVRRRPQIGIIVTGNELKEPGEDISAGFIRNSNAYQLIGQVQRMFIHPEYLGIADDSEHSLDILVEKALREKDVILISGGVSMGDYDLVPGVLKANGVGLLFDRVAMQPGKPLTFGLKDKKAIFAFPGNPVATFLSFELMTKPFIYKLMGCDFFHKIIRCVTGDDFQRKNGDRRGFVPVRMDNGKVFPVEFHSSAHISALCSAAGFISFPVDVVKINRGETVDVTFL